MLNNYPEEFIKIIKKYELTCRLFDLEEANYCLNEMIDSETFGWYQKVAQIAKAKNIKRVFDVGANIGIQRYFFQKLGIEYIPVDERAMPDINDSLRGLIEKTYPFNIKNKEGDMLISHLCLGYLIDFKDCTEHLKGFDAIALDINLDSENSKEFIYEKFFDDSFGYIMTYSK